MDFASKATCGDHCCTPRFEKGGSWNLAGAPRGFGLVINLMDTVFDLLADSSLLSIEVGFGKTLDVNIQVKGGLEGGVHCGESDAVRIDTG